MAVGMLLQSGEFNQELYDSVMEHLEWDEKDLPEGFVSHYAGPTKNGWLVFDVWESQEDFERFLEQRLGQAINAATGGQPPSLEPQFVPIHNQDHERSRV
jgi:heme-degrading monooxygenase HmoA